MNSFNSFPIQIKIGPSDASADSIQNSRTNNGSLVARGPPLVRGKRELRVVIGRSTACGSRSACAQGKLRRRKSSVLGTTSTASLNPPALLSRLIGSFVSIRGRKQSPIAGKWIL